MVTVPYRRHTFHMYTVPRYRRHTFHMSMSPKYRRHTFHHYGYSPKIHVIHFICHYGSESQDTDVIHFICHYGSSPKMQTSYHMSLWFTTDVIHFICHITVPRYRRISYTMVTVPRCHTFHMSLCSSPKIQTSYICHYGSASQVETSYNSYVTMVTARCHAFHMSLWLQSQDGHYGYSPKIQTSYISYVTMVTVPRYRRLHILYPRKISHQFPHIDCTCTQTTQDMMQLYPKIQT